MSQSNMATVNQYTHILVNMKEEGTKKKEQKAKDVHKLPFKGDSKKFLRLSWLPFTDQNLDTGSQQPGGEGVAEK